MSINHMFRFISRENVNSIMAHRKGVSPLIAVLMLIGVTLIVAGILAGWATNLAQTQRRTFEQCIDARFHIDKASFNSTAGTLYIRVYNDGSVPLNLIPIAEYKESAIKFDTIVLDRNSIANIYIQATNDIEGVTIQTEECPGVSDSISRRNIQGI